MDSLPDLPPGQPHAVRGEFIDPSDDKELPFIEKSQEEHDNLLATLRTVDTFKTHDDDLLDGIVRLLEREEVEPGEFVFQQDDLGNHFYIIDKGRFAYSVDGRFVGEYNDSGTFGELALYFENQRIADMKALTAGTLWKLERFSYRRLQARLSFSRIDLLKQAFRKIELFAKLESDVLSRLIDNTDQIRFKAGEIVVSPDKPVPGLFVVESGTLEVATGTAEKRTVKRGDCFGETSLVGNDVDHYEVKAITPAVCAFVSVENFQQRFGKYLGENLNLEAQEETSQTEEEEEEEAMQT